MDRAHYIRDLRKLADLLEANPALALPRIKVQSVETYLDEHYGLREDELRALNEAAKGAARHLPQPPSYLPDPSAPAQSWPPSRVGPPEHWADDWDSPEDTVYDDMPPDALGFKSFADHLAAAVRRILP